MHQPPVALRSRTAIRPSPTATSSPTSTATRSTNTREQTRPGHKARDRLPLRPATTRSPGFDRDDEDSGAIVEFNRAGTITHHQPRFGPGRLNHPSPVELLPSGIFMRNDDYKHRMVAIDLKTGAFVRRYGITEQPARARRAQHSSRLRPRPNPTAEPRRIRQRPPLRNVRAQAGSEQRLQPPRILGELSARSRTPPSLDRFSVSRRSSHELKKAREGNGGENRDEEELKKRDQEGIQEQPKIS